MTDPTARELEVFAAVCRLGSVKAAARELGLGENTVRTHLRVVYSKLGVSGRLAAAGALGWLTPPGLIQTS